MPTAGGGYSASSTDIVSATAKANETAIYNFGQNSGSGGGGGSSDGSSYTGMIMVMGLLVVGGLIIIKLFR